MQNGLEFHAGEKPGQNHVEAYALLPKSILKTAKTDAFAKVIHTSWPKKARSACLPADIINLKVTAHPGC